MNNKLITHDKPPDSSSSYLAGRMLSNLKSAKRHLNLISRKLSYLVFNIREIIQTRTIQKRKLEKLKCSQWKNLIVFLVPQPKKVTGGVMQIYSLQRITQEYFRNSRTGTLICWIPGEGINLSKHGGFKNDITVFPLTLVLKSIPANCRILLHLPEFATVRILNNLGRKRLFKLRDIHRLRLNILNQNTEVMLAPEELSDIKTLFPDLTCTVGNAVWASDTERERLGIPLHVVPTWYYPDDAPWQPYESKSDLMIVSPDRHPAREMVLEAIHAALPGLEIRVIQGLEYEQYLDLEKRAKWSLTFGEGLDGYFYGPVLRGGIAFAVRNGTFDLLQKKSFKTLYDSYDDMINHIANDISILDNKISYESYNSELRTPLLAVLGPDRTSRAMTAYYKGNLTQP